jgi:hypothetical protein
MPEHKRKSQRICLQLGAAFVVTTSLPLFNIVAEAATAPDKLSALRAAASSGEVDFLLDSSRDAAVKHLELAGGFDNQTSAPADGGDGDTGKSSPDSGK